MAIRLYGIDFSGARYAGRSIWIAEATLGETLTVRDCFRAREQFGSRREKCHEGLTKWLAERGDSVIGLDFPFGLPQRVMQAFGWSSWRKVISGLGARFATPEEFKAAYFAVERREIRRATDIDAKTPFAPCNLWLYRQTFYGIRDVLAPLLSSGRVVVLPMQGNALHRPVRVVEICPASTLKTLFDDGVPSYKRNGSKGRMARKRLLERLKQEGVETLANVKARALEDPKGDALDSVVAAFAVGRALGSGFAAHGREALLEGFVFI